MSQIPSLRNGTAQERIEEAGSTGAEAIVTACPWCEKTFNETIKGNGSGLKVYDIVETCRESNLIKGVMNHGSK